MVKRTLGRSGIEAGAIGMGCWAAGGPAWRGDHPIGWGEVDDAESIRAIHRAIDLGANLFDTANVYGAGHSERILGKAIAGKRDGLVIATKFYSVFDEETKQCPGGDHSPDAIRSACDARWAWCSSSRSPCRVRSPRMSVSGPGRRGGTSATTRCGIC